ncbi:MULTISPECIES: type VII toxin-antitoxin system HepT family RNase toxin [unclassified Maridesulfovibrio]|uniref:type VII toxin-antitoxin system HepT family RNase toxin n=1 Tax=unclassified Maridesulfovibrio TaxID=2794999 RepID=UPI003B410D25
MNQKVIEVKLVSLQRCLERIKQKTPSRVEVLASDYDLQDIVILNLQRAVQISVDIATHILSAKFKIPSSMAESFIYLGQEKILDKNLAERLSRSVGLRNIAVHEYMNLDWEIVHAVSLNHLDDFSRFGDAVLQWLDSNK